MADFDWDDPPLENELPKGGAGTAETQDGKSRVVYVLTEIKQTEPPSKAEAEKLTKSLQLQFQNDARTVLVAALRNRIGVTVDEVAYKRLLGTEQQR